MIKIDFNRSFFKSFLNIFSILCTSLCVFFIITTLLVNNSYKAKIQEKIISYDGYASIYNHNYNYLDEDDYVNIHNKLNNFYKQYSSRDYSGLNVENLPRHNYGHEAWRPFI